MIKIRNNSLVYAIAALAVAFFIGFFNSEALAAPHGTAKGPYYWTDPGGFTHGTGLITVDGRLVYCVDPHLPAPYEGHNYKEPKRQYDDGVKAILYYGYGGDGNEVGNSMPSMVKTYVALNNWLDGKTDQRTYSNRDPQVWKLIQHAKNGDAPAYQISFNKKEVNSSVSNNVQKSETITLNGNGSATFAVPSAVTIHVGSKSQKGGNITINAGQSFYFTAPLSYNSDFSSGNVNGRHKELASLLYLPNNNSVQRLMGAQLVDDPIAVAGFKVKFEARTKNITVNYIDEYTKEVLKKTTETKTIGSKYSYTPPKTIKKGNDTFVAKTTTPKSGTLGNNDVTINFYYNLERTITIKHVDNRDKKVLKTDTETKLRGEKYSYSPRTDLKKGDYTYRPISKDKQTGTVGGSNITLTFYYDVPLIKTGLDKIQIYTAPSKDGLPVKINLSKKNIYPDTVADMTKEKIKVSLYQGKTLMDSKEYTAKTLPKSLDMKIPSKYLTVDTKKPYTVKLEGYSTTAIDVPKDELSLTTDGYTSAERALKIDAASEKKAEYKGVVMTEREVKKDMKVFYETWTVPIQKMKKMRTGYGFEMLTNIEYENDIGNSNTDFSFNMTVPEELVDKSFLEYPVKNKKATIPLEQTENSSSKNGEQQTSKQVFELPHMNIERLTGHLFNDAQVKNKDKRIKNELIDGKRKFYIPIWGHVGDYSISVASDKDIGINKMNFEVAHNLNVFAHMFAHMDSETIQEDAILMTPVSADNPFPEGLPEDWTNSDVEWIKNNNW